MIICGANGTGKSTLLWALKQRSGLTTEGNTNVLYQGPHRAIRRQTVRRAWLGGALTSFIDSLSADSVSVPEGLSIPYPSRSPDNIDETGSAIKHALGRLENRRQSFVTSRVDKAINDGESSVDVSAMPQIFEPLAEIVSRLLPHLTFKCIDFAQEDNIRVVFKREDFAGNIELDLDDLSSGEKAVVLLFLPLVESEIRDRLALVETPNNEPAPAPADRIFLLDEPELHLHPDLQRRMLAYLRERSSTGRNQFILITHSPTILDEATDDELYVLAPPRGDQNQLRRAASPSERLDALRELTGESYFLSTGRNIVCIEGEAGSVKGKLSDRSLIELLTPRSGRYTFVPMGGKSQVLAAVSRLRSSLPAEEYGVCVVGLLDSDRSDSAPEGTVYWPFCEIENVLIVPELIRDVAGELAEVDLTVQKVTEILTTTAHQLRDDEVRLRVGYSLGVDIVRPSGTTADVVRESYKREIAKLSAKMSSNNIEDAVSAATSSVDRELADGSYVKKFRGKKLLRGAFNSLGLANFSYEQFCYTLAIRGKGLELISDPIHNVFSQLDAEVTRQMTPLLTRDAA